LAKAVDDKVVYETEELEAINKECFAAATKIFRAKAVGGKYWKLEDELDVYLSSSLSLPLCPSSRPFCPSPFL
jgi:hypothetical protein